MAEFWQVFEDLGVDVERYRMRDLYREGKLKGHVAAGDEHKDEAQQTVVLQDSSGAILRFIESLPAEEGFAEAGTSRKVD